MPFVAITGVICDLANVTPVFSTEGVSAQLAEGLVRCQSDHTRH